MKRKALALVLCLAVILSVTLPGTLAVSIGSDSSESTVVLPTGEATSPETTGQATGGNENTEIPPVSESTSDNNTDETVTNVTNNVTDSDAKPVDGESADEKPVDDKPACTCGAEGETHKEDCPLYKAPEVEEAPEGTMPVLDTGDVKHGSAKTFTNVAPLVPAGIATPFLRSSNARAATSRAGEDPESGVVLNKTATVNSDGSFDITLEAYATGTTSTEEKDVVADIVLVLDTSASMKYPIDGEAVTTYRPVYGDMNKVNEDGTGHTSFDEYVDQYGDTIYSSKTIQVIKAYGVEGHDATQYDSNMYTYYVEYNGKIQKAYYYSEVDENTESYRGWRVWDSEVGIKTGLIPKTSKDDNTDGHYQFYVIDEEKSSLYALKQSVNNFIDNISKDSPNSHIAIVPYGTKIGTITTFISASETETLKGNVNDLTASGDTNTGEAMATAYSMVSNLDQTHADHKKVVIMFTDGLPTSVSNKEFDVAVADRAITSSHSLKDANVGATVYTVGIFSGADGNLSSFKENNSTDPNTFMHLVSSNYPDATSMTNHGNVNPNLNGKSYYLSASNSADLNDIFQKISYEVSGALNADLGTSTVVKDIIAPSFSIPADAQDITVSTANCTGNGTNGFTFGDITPRNDLNVTIDEDNAAVNVTGFDFSANWCGYRNNGYSGKKLIIEFTVSPKAGFLGGNDVPTNGETSGLYMGNGTLVETFVVPTVNVPIADITITATDKNVYLTQVPTEEQLKSGVTIKCGDVDITDPSKLEDWQKAYVNIESGLTTSTGFDATADGTYTVTATVSPKTESDSNKPGTVAQEKKVNVTKSINVFKPELTFKDSDVYYGDTAPTDYSGNLTKTEWKHGDTQSTAVTMIGTAPTLSLTYDPGAGVVDGKIAVKTDIPVNVTVKIGTTDVTGKTSFVHTPCTTGEAAPTDGKFWLHVKTCTLTIIKAAGTNTTIGNDEYFVFTVYKDNDKYTEVTIKGTGSVTISELPVGTYTITEDTSVAWRYGTPTYSENAVLSSTSSTGTLTCTNTKNTDNWINDFTRVINTYGKIEGEIK